MNGTKPPSGEIHIDDLTPKDMDEALKPETGTDKLIRALSGITELHGIANETNIMYFSIKDKKYKAELPYGASKGQISKIGASIEPSGKGQGTVSSESLLRFIGLKDKGGNINKKFDMNRWVIDKDLMQ